MTIVGALCAGYGGLELGLVAAGIDHQLAWCAEIDPNAATVMAAHHPTAPNLGDLTTITDPPTADIITAGFPCQPVSVAGRREGVNDERWIVDDVCRVARLAGAHTLILENVAGILTANNGDALARVCEAMAREGFSRWEWCTLRAGDVGAPHRRKRWFCIATADPDGEGLRRNRIDASVDLNALTGSHPDRRHRQRFGGYAEAVARWEHTTGRPAPDPTIDGRLSHRFVEWMMGLRDGWVTDHLDRRPALRVLGNGVVPQQAAAAVNLLIR